MSSSIMTCIYVHINIPKCKNDPFCIVVGNLFLISHTDITVKKFQITCQGVGVLFVALQGVP